MAELLQAPPTSVTSEPGFAARHIGPSAAEQAEMLAVVGAASVEALLEQAIPAAIRRRDPLPLPAGRARARLPRAPVDGGVEEPGLPLVHRPRLLRHDHAGRDPAQRLREPGLVHALHALPGRDRPGPPRVAAQLPDRGEGPHRDGRRQRLAARRGDRRGRGDGAGPSRLPAQGRARVPRRPHRVPADAGAAGGPRRTARARAARRRRRDAPKSARTSSACCCSRPTGTGWSAICRRSSPASTRARRSPSSPATCWPAR